ncbi:hypothetical protein [Streptomyces griseoaurantiacus]|uniref:hypothetical protein n=1 Tax=Streptomyces griseoaurantiacus TaxID=68213 RepID=UPI003686D87A
MTTAYELIAPERLALLGEIARSTRMMSSATVIELLKDIEQLRANGGEKRRPLACGLCYEEHGEEVHPHPECTWGRYPEHDKLTKVKDKSQAVYDFLQFATKHGVDLGRTVTTRVAVFEGSEDCTAVQPVEGLQLQELLAKHFGVDLVKLDQEKERMIDELRALNTPEASRG